MHPASDRTSLGSLLMDAGLVTQSQLDAALKIARIMRVRLGEVFVRFGGQGHVPALSEHQIEAALAKQAHGRAKRRPIVGANAALRALQAAHAERQAHACALSEGAEAARKITVNEDL